MRFILAALLLLVPVASRATTVRRAALDELVNESHMVVRAHVAFVDDRAGEQTGKYETRVGLEVDEGIKGFASNGGIYELMLPGGRVGGLSMVIPGQPAFEPGQEVVVMVKHTPAGDTITGLGQGIFRVDRSSGLARARRLDLDETRIVDRLGRDAKAELIDAPLGELLARLRTLSVAVPR